MDSGTVYQLISRTVQKAGIPITGDTGFFFFVGQTTLSAHALTKFRADRVIRPYKSGLAHGAEQLQFFFYGVLNGIVSGAQQLARVESFAH